MQLTKKLSVVKQYDGTVSAAFANRGALHFQLAPLAGIILE
jgi:hypothetical protein